MKWNAHDYQRRAARFLLERKYAGALLDPGLGKTSILLSVLKRLKLRGKNKAALIITPVRPCYLVWPREVEKWDNFNGLTVSILHGKDKDRALTEPADIYLINPEGLPWLFKCLKGMRDWPFDILAVDESHKFKSTNSERWRLLKRKLYKFERRYILTGSVTPKSLLDLFAQAYILDEGEAFGGKVTDFKKQYFYRTGYGGFNWKVRKSQEPKIHERVSSMMIQMSAEEYLNLPELIINDVLVEMPPDALKAYREVEDALRTDFKAGRVTAANAAIASHKCRQIASGGIYLDGLEHEMKQVHYAKAEAVNDIVEELNGHPALIAYEYRHDLVRLKEVLGKNTPHIGSGVSMKRTIELEKKWNRGELPALLGQPQSVSLGLNLQQQGKTVIWHTLTHRFDDYDQFIRRVWRQGQKSERVIVHRILVKNTIELAVVKSLAAKDTSQKALYRSINEYWEENA